MVRDASPVYEYPSPGINGHPRLAVERLPGPADDGLWNNPYDIPHGLPGSPPPPYDWGNPQPLYAWGDPPLLRALPPLPHVAANERGPHRARLIDIGTTFTLCAILTVDVASLRVLLMRDRVSGNLGLPMGDVCFGEPPPDAARRIVRAAIGRYPELLAVNRVVNSWRIFPSFARIVEPMFVSERKQALLPLGVDANGYGMNTIQEVWKTTLYYAASLDSDNPLPPAREGHRHVAEWIAINHDLVPERFGDENDWIVFWLGWRKVLCWTQHDEGADGGGEWEWI